MLRYSIIALVFVLLCGACDENAPVIPPLGPQDVGDRKVLIEEFTGVRCPNCPDGSAEIENLIVRYGENLVPVSIHASGGFAVPHAESKYDFRTDAGNQLLDFLGEPLGYPSAVVNRTTPSSSSRLQQPVAAWAGIIEAALQEEPIVAIDLVQMYDATSRALSINVSLVPNQVIPDAQLSVMLLEDHITDPQDTRETTILDYDHRHVFRAMLSEVDGDTLGSLNKLGEVQRYTYTYTLPDGWKATDCSVVAFVHHGRDTKEILQVETIKLK